MTRSIPHLGNGRGVAQHRKFHQPVVENGRVRPPIPYFGKKTKCAPLVWSRFGRVDTYIEPCCGSLGVALQSPYGAAHHEIFNDVNGFVCNFLRAIRNRPKATAAACDRYNTHADLVAAHGRLVESEPDLTERLFDDLDYCNPELAGLWAWSTSLSIRMGADLGCSYMSPRRLEAVELPEGGYRVPLSEVDEEVDRPVLDGSRLLPWFTAMSERIRESFVICVDWSTLFTPAKLWRDHTRMSNRIAGIFFDPPYPGLEDAYSHSDSISHDIFEWCVENGDHPRLRICLAGYEGLYPEFPEGWTSTKWKRAAGLEITSGRSDHEGRIETLWFSPNCLDEEQRRLV